MTSTRQVFAEQSDTCFQQRNIWSRAQPKIPVSIINFISEKGPNILLIP